MALIKAFCPKVSHIEETDSVAATLRKLVTYRPDILFLDMELGDGTGLDILAKAGLIDYPVIFITAHDKYAIEAFRYSAIDFLLKPVDPEMLVNAIHKAETKIDALTLTCQLSVLKEYIASLPVTEKKIVLKDSDNIFFVRISDIVRCESDGSYTTFYLVTGEKIVISKTIKEYDLLLEKFGFIRAHQSHLVNISKVRRFDKSDGGMLILDNGHSVPVSQRKRESILNILKNL